jgi:trimeric autotransporter adhesin
MNWRIWFIGVVFLSCSLHAQVPCDEHWDIRFGASGADNNVFSLLRHGGDIYIGGLISLAGDVNATNIARWDGTNWHALGPGIGSVANVLSAVYSLGTDGRHIYAGGYFTNSGGLAFSSSVARWNGVQWSEIGNLRGIPIYLQFHEGILYAAGTLAVPGDTNVYGIARWDGSSWTPMGSMLSGGAVINLLFDPGGGICAVGDFTTIDGIPAQSAAKWNGVSWSAWGTGFTGTNPSLTGLVRHQGQIYASGLFQFAGGVPAQNMAVWNGSDWQPFSGANNEVRRLLSDGTSLYAAGDFTTIGGIPAVRAARWNGLSWAALGTGPSSDIYDAVLNGSELLVGGSFVMAGSVPAVTVARWDGAEWRALNSGRQQGMNLPLGIVRAFDVFNGDLYAGGDFVGAGAELHSKVARWNGVDWSALGSGIIGPSGHRIRAIAHSTHVQDLYAGGTFTNIGGVIASNVAVWKGLSWQSMGQGVNSNVHALAYDPALGNLYVAGAFTRAGGALANRIAYWQAGSGLWFAMGSGVNSNVNALLMWNGNLIVGGQFTTAGAVVAHKIAEFGDFGISSWRAIGGNAIPPGGNVLALATIGTNLYVAGNFVIPGINATNIARWDGVAWSALGRGLLGRNTTPINALAVHGGELYAGGSLTNASGLPVQALAKWDGTNWHALGSGVQMNPGGPTVNALSVYDNAIYAGGLFHRAGGRVSVCIARWIPDINLQITGASYDSDEFRLQAQSALGLKLRLDATSDLATWIPVQQKHSYSNIADLVDQAPVPNRRLYRVLAAP